MEFECGSKAGLEDRKFRVGVRDTALIVQTRNQGPGHLSESHSVEEPPHMCKNQACARTLTHSILHEQKKKIGSNLVREQGMLERADVSI